MAIKGYNFYDERPVFYGFYLRKKNGKKLSAHDLTYNVMESLWADELVKDADIADLFDVSIDLVRDIHYSYGLDHATCIKNHVNEAFQVLGTLGARIMAI